jgi:predicted HAD superfamily phosphohydrolase
MKNQDVLIVHPSSQDQVTVLKAFLEALKIKFEFIKEQTYDPEFVEKILESKREIADGHFTDLKSLNLQEFIDTL